jgi:hypothetical protein
MSFNKFFMFKNRLTKTGAFAVVHQSNFFEEQKRNNSHTHF